MQLYIVFFVLDGTCPGAIANPVYYSTYCLGLEEKQENKYNADGICTGYGYGGRLVEIDSAEMQTFIRSEIDKRALSAYWWIGASVNTTKRYWEWTDGKAIC